MTGEPDPLYVRAREVLLDALEALGPHRGSIILVGAQAIYLHTGEADLAVAPFTTDADVVLDPHGLGESPTLGDLLEGAGFTPAGQPGQWVKDSVRLDLMVPEAVAGPGRRGARLVGHGSRAARKARGLEGALVDHELRPVGSLAHGTRRVEVAVAGPAGLLVSKLHKLAERVGEPGRLKDKDALDVLRLLHTVPVALLAGRIALLQQDARSAAVTNEALGLLARLFGRTDSPGSALAARAVEGLEDPDTVRASCAALVEELRAAIG